MQWQGGREWKAVRLQVPQAKLTGEKVVRRYTIKAQQLSIFCSTHGEIGEGIVGPDDSLILNYNTKAKWHMNHGCEVLVRSRGNVSPKDRLKQE